MLGLCEKVIKENGCTESILKHNDNYYTILYYTDNYYYNDDDRGQQAYKMLSRASSG